MHTEKGVEAERLSEKERYWFSYDSQKIRELFAFYGVKGETDSKQLENFIDEIHARYLLNKHSPSASESKCEYRIQYEKNLSYIDNEGKIHKQRGIVNACVKNPPRIVKLDSLQICRVCISMNACQVCAHLWRLKAAKTEQQSRQPVKVGEVETSPPENSTALLTDPDAAQKIRNPQNTEYQKAGLTYCFDGGMWVLPQKCDLCKQNAFPTWYECQLSRLRKQGNPSNQASKT